MQKNLNIEKIDHFDPYNVFLAFATNIPQRLKTGFVVQGHIFVLIKYLKSKLTFISSTEQFVRHEKFVWWKRMWIIMALVMCTKYFFYEIEEVVKCLHALFFLIDRIIFGLHHPFQSDRSFIWLRLNRIL